VPEVHISAEPRTEFGKGAARRVRRNGQVPAVIYGHGTDPTHIALPGHDLMLALKTPNVLLQVALASEDFLTLPKAVQRDPVRQTVEHVDLVIVRSGEKVTVEVPVIVSGRVVGGLIELVVAAVSLDAEATHIPSEIAVNVDGAEIGSVIRAGDLTLAPGTALAGDPEQIIVAIAAPTVEEEEPEAAPVEGEAAEGAAGAPEPADEG
jgi:large subunit ribosomal protein L25